MTPSSAGDPRPGPDRGRRRLGKLVAGPGALLGSVAGEGLGDWLGALLAWRLGASVALSVALAFGLGYTLPYLQLAGTGLGRCTAGRWALGCAVVALLVLGYRDGALP